MWKMPHKWDKMVTLYVIKVIKMKNDINIINIYK